MSGLPSLPPPIAERNQVDRFKHPCITITSNGSQRETIPEHRDDDRISVTYATVQRDGSEHL